MTLGEILPHNHSLVDPVQLVLLWRDEDFKQIGQEEVISRLVADLKYLEESWFQSDGTIIKAGLINFVLGLILYRCFVVVIEHFSASQYLFWNCLMDRETFCQQSLHFWLKRTN